MTPVKVERWPRRAGQEIRRVKSHSAGVMLRCLTLGPQGEVDHVGGLAG